MKLKVRGHFHCWLVFLHKDIVVNMSPIETVELYVWLFEC